MIIIIFHLKNEFAIITCKYFKSNPFFHVTFVSFVGWPLSTPLTHNKFYVLKPRKCKLTGNWVVPREQCGGLLSDVFKDKNFLSCIVYFRLLLDSSCWGRKEWVTNSNLSLSFLCIAAQSYYNKPEMSYQGLHWEDSAHTSFSFITLLSQLEFLNWL